MSENVKIIAQNKKARFDYFVEEKYECGIVLEGTEVKSVKEGNVSFNDSFAEIQNGELWMRNFHISEYKYSSIFNHNPDRAKKLLVHKEELKRIQRKVDEKGFTLIPLDFYLKNGRVKLVTISLTPCIAILVINLFTQVNCMLLIRLVVLLLNL